MSVQRCVDVQGYDLWTRQESQRRDVLREVVRRVGVRGVFDNNIKAAGAAIFVTVKPVSAKKPRTQEDVDVILKVRACTRIAAVERCKRCTTIVGQ